MKKLVLPIATHISDNGIDGRKPTEIYHDTIFADGTIFEETQYDAHRGPARATVVRIGETAVPAPSHNHDTWLDHVVLENK